MNSYAEFTDCIDLIETGLNWFVIMSQNLLILRKHMVLKIEIYL